jgi:hypothetical protein
MTIDIVKLYYINDYNQDMHRLYLDLAEYISTRFPSGIIDFRSNERIVFLNDDLDFYINDNYPGFSLYNIQLILAHLDIPNFFCAVISNTPNYKFYTNMVRDILRPDDVPLRGITSLSACIGRMVKKSLDHIDLNQDQIEYPFISLSRATRVHRTFFMAKLFEHNLQNKGLVSYHNIKVQEELGNFEMSPLSTKILDTPFSFLYTKPFTQYNTSDMRLTNQHNKNLFVSFDDTVKKYRNFQDSTDIKNKITAGHLHSAPTQQSLVYVGLESAAVYPAPFLSLISFKGIATKRPFIILGVPNTIKYLQDLGFKTFNNWWDESYDLEPDLETRADMIISLIDQISNYSVSQLRKICVDMSEVLQYNHQHLASTFIGQEQEKIDQILNQQFI